MRPEDAIALPAPLARMRRFPLDGALLLFDRDTGWNALVDGPETAHLRMRAPRVVQFGITNHCNLSCGYCSRDASAESAWTADDAFEMLAGLASEGVLEVAFGGGEPFAFKDLPALVRRLREETPLAVHVTTNGAMLDDRRLDAIEGAACELRVSAHEGAPFREAIARLVARRVRFGVNLLVFPARLAALEADVFELAALGVRDVLLLSYNGPDRALHVGPDAAHGLSTRIDRLSRALSGRVTIKLDVCWGSRMRGVPRLFARDDCGAGLEHVVVDSDRRVRACSFHHVSFPILSAEDVLAVWRDRREALGSAARDPGCARTPDFGLRDVRRLAVL